jgi:hypothetical protein
MAFTRIDEATLPTGLAVAGVPSSSTRINTSKKTASEVNENEKEQRQTNQRTRTWSR